MSMIRTIAAFYSRDEHGRIQKGTEPVWMTSANDGEYLGLMLTAERIAGITYPEKNEPLWADSPESKKLYSTLKVGDRIAI
jgi:hypothetical protein